MTAALLLLGSVFPYRSWADELGLTISNLRVSTTDTTATIQWTTTMPASGRVEYGTTNRYGAIYGVQGERRTSHLLTLTNLTPATTYHYRVISQTEIQEVTSFDQTFTTDLAKDRDAPEITDVVVPFQTPTAVVIQWRTNEPADSQVVFGKNPSYGQQAGDGARVTVHDLTISGLQPATAYHFQVRARDAAGNVGISNNFSFRTASEATGTPSLELVSIRPVAVNDPGITDTAAEISWRTTTLADGRVHWGETSHLGRTVTLPPPRDFFHVTKLTGLLPGTTYYFRVESRDVFGVSVQSPIYSFATRASTPISRPVARDGTGLDAATTESATFYASYDQGINADTAVGDPTAMVMGGSPTITEGNGGFRGAALRLNDGDYLRYQGPGNFSLREGTMAFWFKPNWNPKNNAGHQLFIFDPERFVADNLSVSLIKFGDLVAGRDFPAAYPKFTELSQSLAFFLKDNQQRAYHIYLPAAHLIQNEWQFITVTWQYGGGPARLYHNASAANVRKKVDSIDASGDVNLGSAPSNLGQFLYLGPGTPGGMLLDDLTAFNHALTEDEIKLLYAEGVARMLPRAAAPAPTPIGRILGASTLQYTPATALLKAADEPDVYAILNGQKHKISGPSSFAAYGYRWSDVHTVPAEVLEKIPHARLVRTLGNDGIFYLYQRPQNLWLKLLLPSPTVFISYPGNLWGNVITINEIDFTSYPDVRLIKTPDDPTVYLLEGVIKRRIESDAVFDRLQLPRSHVAEVNSVHLNFYPMGSSIIP